MTMFYRKTVLGITADSANGLEWFTPQYVLDALTQVCHARERHDEVILFFLKDSEDESPKYDKTQNVEIGKAEEEEGKTSMINKGKMTWQQMAEALWGILDDISTAGDIAKDDDKTYRRLMEKMCEKRSKYLVSYDGQTLVPVVQVVGSEQQSGDCVASNDGELVQPNCNQTPVKTCQHPREKEENAMPEQTFETELEVLINRYSIENESNTPDFILVRLVREVLTVFASISKMREDWYGHRHESGQTDHRGQLRCEDYLSSTGAQCVLPRGHACDHLFREGITSA